MRSYIITSGLLFASLVVAHVLRLFLEGFSVVGNPIFLVTTIASASMSVWSCIALKLLRASKDRSAV